MKMKKYLMTGIAALALCVGFTSCSHDLESLSEEEINELQAKKIVDNYNKAFKAYIGGEVASTQTWGFGVADTRTRSGNTGEGYTSYPATHTYTDANGNVIAGANMNCNEWADPNKQFGGWQVPDPLTEGQKLRVKLYFQANPDLTYEDPQYANFFVQQVYTGGTSAPETGNKESTKAADGTVHAGATLNQLTVGTACSHINNFNAGTCTERDVLDNGQTVNGGTTHKDQITLMVNVDDTSCFGYHETGGSNVKGVINHNDKMALVDAATIDAWAAQNGNPGEAVVDKWNRSFMGFDYELLPEEDIIPENPTYAKFTNVPAYNNIQYAWDGTQLMVIGEKPAAVAAGTEVDLTSYFANCYNGSVTNNENGIEFTSNGWAGLQAYTFGNANKWSNYTKFVIEFKEATPVATKIQLGDAGTHDIAAGTTKFELDLTEVSAEVNSGVFHVEAAATIKISKIYLITGAQEDNTVYYDPNGYLLGDDNKVMFYSSSNTNMYGGKIIELTENEMKTTQDGKTCLNLVKFKELADGGYHPISTDLKKWVKWEAACDGYYSDWIVTLTKAKRIGEEDPDSWSVRVMAEDLSATDASDFDFNDVVFDVAYTEGQSTATITLLAAGGTLPLRVNSTNGVGGFEVHAAFGEYPTTTMINTGWTGSNGANNVAPAVLTIENFSATDEASFLAAVKAIRIEVRKTLSTGDYEWLEMKAEAGEPASKFAVPVGTTWCTERTSIKAQYETFAEWARTGSLEFKWW
jgi:hypothetical protein